MARKKGWQWPWIVGGLMAVVIGANLILIHLATSDPSFAVEEDYYQKALDWDQKRAQDRTNAQLGWMLDLDVARERSADGSVEVTVSLADREGRPIPDASIHLRAFHNARAAHIFESDLARGATGRYTASLPLRRPGQWEFRREAERAGTRFTYTTLQELYWR